MTSRERPEINMSRIPVAGAGGLGLLAVALVMTLYYPQAWWLLAIGLVGGTGVGVALVLYRRHRQVTGPSDTDPTVLFRSEPTGERTSSAEKQSTSPFEELSLPDAGVAG